MAMRRSTQMLFLGLAVFVIGAGVVVIALGGGDGGAEPAAAATTSTTVQAGTVVIPAATGAPVPATFTIPEGKQAVAVQVPWVNGLAGYAAPGDLVNVYATVEKGTNTATPPPLAKLVLAGVQVLAVSGPGPGSGAGNTTYLLALDASQAEQVIFFARFEPQLWMTLAPKGQPAPTTPGHTYANAF